MRPHSARLEDTVMTDWLKCTQTELKDASGEPIAPPFYKNGGHHHDCMAEMHTYWIERYERLHECILILEGNAQRPFHRHERMRPHLAKPVDTIMTVWLKCSQTELRNTRGAPNATPVYKNGEHHHYCVAEMHTDWTERYEILHACVLIL
jgi:hypothetical protein